MIYIVFTNNVKLIVDKMLIKNIIYILHVLYLLSTYKYWKKYNFIKLI